MTQLDPRLHAFRDDLAAASLQDRVRAPRYSEGEIRQVAAPSAPIRVSPRFDATLATEALSGELLTVYDIRDGWAWVQLRDDGYVGYTPLDGLSTMVEENTYRVSARLTYLYPAPDMKRPPVTKMSFSCTVAPIGKLEGRFVELSRGGFIFADHLVGIRERAKDFARVAERLVGVPYLWGGKTTLGIDCSGLVQLAQMAAGIPCLRDSDMQLSSAGDPIDPSNLDAIQRGDLLFWKGHVAIAQSADWMIHASGHHMEVVVEQIRRAVERTAETHGPLLAILRPNLETQAQAQVQPAQASARRPAPDLAAMQAPTPQASAPKPSGPEPVATNAQPATAASANPKAEAQTADASRPVTPRPVATPHQQAAERQERAPGPQPDVKSVRSPEKANASDEGKKAANRPAQKT